MRINIKNSIETESKSVFGEFAENYHSSRNVSFYGRIARSIFENNSLWPTLNNESSGLDLGCGTGISMGIAMEAAPKIKWVGVDASNEMLSVARSKLQLDRCNLLKCNAESLPFPDNSFDWVISCMAFHWMRPETSEEVMRVLKTSGKFSMRVPLLVPVTIGEGNIWLSNVFKRFFKYVKNSRSLGLTIENIEQEFRNFKTKSISVLDFDEEFSSLEDLKKTLEVRGSFSAIFGKDSALVLNELQEKDLGDSQKVLFRWKVGAIEAIK